MRRNLFPAILAVVCAVLLFTTWSARSDVAKSDGGLPGARPAIDAAKFPSLQAAFDALPAEGGVVNLPAGTFEITEPLVLSRSDVLIQGAGTATHIKNVNTAGKPALVIQHPDGKKVKKDDRLWRVMLSNFRITGNEKSGHGIEAILVNEILLQGVSVSYHGGDGVRLDFCYEDPRVSNCLITYNKATGLNLIGCHDIVVSANQFEENQDALHCFDGFNLCMTGNCLDDHLGHGVVIENTYGSVVSGNMIEECNGTAIILDRDCYGNTLSANIIAHDGGGIDLRDAHGCAVSANTFTIMKTHALRIGPGSGRITVTGNNFSNSYVGDGKVRRGTEDLAAAGMTLEGTSNVTVSGNLFADVKPKAVSAEGEPSRGILFADNVLVDVESDHGKLKESRVDGNLGE
ncbi:MAG: right-handed parallel beta-helix repeat-containing protein [Planctomycetaceae bacterium]|jgi:parallel beta-helix repeat protein|nr:right-handed parallel beta-helix repeat-containing protein [Planctomycetaceae bacterium]MBT6485643.1 right-handed parallel beta-helix repeat-containing protein [Planctomycetaceae bacterium]MBT6494873.1 right-handed parallel beta-helix repeat-containing protein [Planctomycetaceae bacterium]